MTMDKYAQIKDWIYIAGLLVMAAMIVLPLVDINYEWMKYAYAGGAALTLIARLSMRYPSKKLRIRRLFTIGHVSAVLYCV